MRFLYNFRVKQYIMGFLLLVVILFGTYAAFADTIQGALDPNTSSQWIDIAPYAGYVALGAIILYIPLNLLDKKLYEKALKEKKNNSENS